MTSEIAAIRRELDGIQKWFRANATAVQRDPGVRAAWDHQLARKTSLEIDLALARRRLDPPGRPKKEPV